MRQGTSRRLSGREQRVWAADERSVMGKAEALGGMSCANIIRQAM
jgi:hypothetical protein